MTVNLKVYEALAILLGPPPKQDQTEPSEESAGEAKPGVSHIVDITDQNIGSFIITGAKKP